MRRILSHLVLPFAPTSLYKLRSVSSNIIAVLTSLASALYESHHIPFNLSSSESCDGGAVIGLLLAPELGAR